MSDLEKTYGLISENAAQGGLAVLMYCMFIFICVFPFGGWMYLVYLLAIPAIASLNLYISAVLAQDRKKRQDASRPQHVLPSTVQQSNRVHSIHNGSDLRISDNSVQDVDDLESED